VANALQTVALCCNPRTKSDRAGKKDNIIIYKKKTGDGEYYGRASGNASNDDILGRRNGNHHVAGDGNVIFGPLPYPVARGIEQILIHCAGGIGARGLINKINGVGPKGLSRGGYIKCALQFLEKAGGLGDDGCPAL